MSTPLIISYSSFEPKFETYILIYISSGTIANTCHNPLFPFRQSEVQCSHNPTQIFYFIFVRTQFVTSHNSIGFARKKTQTISFVERGFESLGLGHQAVGFSWCSYMDRSFSP